VATINPLVEGDIDAAIAMKVIQHAGHDSGIVYGRRGIGYIEKKLPGFNRSARGNRYLALVDLMDTKIACSPDVVRAWLPHPEAGMVFRVVEREIESWLMADVNSMADFLGVPPARFQQLPDAIPDPKQYMVNLARQSRRRTVRTALVPDPRSSSPVGALYNVELSAYVQAHWSPQRARALSPSLDLKKWACDGARILVCYTSQGR
jgi:hypothetical protein